MTTTRQPFQLFRSPELSSSQGLLRNIAGVSVVALTVFGINDYIAGRMITVYLFTALVLLYFPLVFWLIHRRHEEGAKLLILLALNLCVLVAALSTPLDDGVRFFFVPVGLKALLFYEVNERRKLVCGLGLPLAGFALSLVPDLRIASPVESAGLALEISKTVNFVGVYAVTIAEILVFIHYIRALRIEAALHSKFSALGILSSGIAHEINNPLTIIKGRSEILARKIDAGADGASLTAEAAAITRNVDRIARIIRGLRLFTRDSGNDPFQPVPASVIVETALDLCQEKIQRAGIRIDVRMDHPLVVQGLETQLAQVLVNLLDNARDAVADTADAWIRIEVLETCIRITDSGSGIPPQIADRIMQPFFTTKAHGQGSGLGLSLCKGILEHHGGELVLDRRSPRTCFIMKFHLTSNDA